ncbi:hypothetical protein CWB96_21470, partial [Pseudoalteromonas citrea]
MFLGAGVKLHMGVNTKMDPDLRQEDQRVVRSIIRSHHLSKYLGNLNHRLPELDSGSICFWALVLSYIWAL